MHHFFVGALNNVWTCWSLLSQYSRINLSLIGHYKYSKNILNYQRKK